MVFHLANAKFQELILRDYSEIEVPVSCVRGSGRFVQIQWETPAVASTSTIGLEGMVEALEENLRL